jgi:hypothetical protein
MAWGTRVNVLMDRLGATLKEGASLAEDDPRAKELGNKVGARVFNTVKDTMFTGEDATIASRVAGGAMVTGAVIGAGAGIQAAQDHPILATGAVIGAGVLAMSNPRNVMDVVSNGANRMRAWSELGREKETAANIADSRKIV